MRKKEKKDLIYTSELEVENLRKNKSYKKLIISIIIILVVAASTIGIIYGVDVAKKSL